MFGKVLHNVYQVRVGPQLHSSSIGCKYLFSPTDVGLQASEQSKSIVTARNHPKNNNASENSKDLDARADIEKNENDESAFNSSSCNLVEITPQSQSFSKPLTKKLFELSSSKKTASRKPSKGTNWYLHHVLPSIQRTTKYHNEKVRNLSIVNEFANRNLRQSRFTRDPFSPTFKVMKQRSQQNANILQIKQSQINILKRPNTVPKRRENNFISCNFPKPSATCYIQPFTNLYVHTQSQAMGPNQSGDDNTANKTNTESSKDNLGMERQVNDTNTDSKPYFTRTFQPKMKSEVNKFCGGDTSLISNNYSSKHKTPNQLSWQMNSKNVKPKSSHSQIYGQSQNEQLKVSLIKDNKLQEMRTRLTDRENLSAIKTNNVLVKKTFSHFSPQTYTYKKPVSTKGELNTKFAPKPIYTFNKKTNLKTTSTLKSAVEEIEKAAQKRKNNFRKRKLNQKCSYFEYQKKPKYEKVDYKQYKVYPPTSTPSSLRLNLSRIITTPPTHRKKHKQSGDQSREVQEIVARKKNIDESELSGMKPEKNEITTTVDHLIKSTRTATKTKLGALKPKEEEHWENYEDNFYEDERKHATDDNEIYRMKRKRLVGSITDNMKPKSAPKLKNKHSQSQLEANEEFENEITDDSEPKRVKLDLRSGFGSKLDIKEIKSKESSSLELMEEEPEVAEKSPDVSKVVGTRNVKTATDGDERRTKRLESKRSFDSEIYDESINKPLPEDEIKIKKYLTSNVKSKKLEIKNETEEMLERDEQCIESYRENDQPTRFVQEPMKKARDLSVDKTRLDNYIISPTYDNLSPLVKSKRNAQNKQNMKNIGIEQNEMVRDFRQKSSNMKIPEAKKEWISDMLLTSLETQNKQRKQDIQQILKHANVRENVSSHLQDKVLIKASGSKRDTENKTLKRKRRESNSQTFRRSSSTEDDGENDCLQLEKDERIKLPDSCLHKKAPKESKHLKTQNKERKLNEFQESKISPKSVKQKSYSRPHIPFTKSSDDDVPKRKVKSNVMIAENKPKEEKKRTLSFHGLRRKSVDKFLQKSSSAKSLMKSDFRDINVLEQWRLRFKKFVKSSIFGRKE